MMKRFVYSTLFFAVTASAAACGGGDSDDRLVSSLGDQDFIEVCESFGYSDAQVRGIAGFQCLLAEAFQPACDDARLATCIDDTYAELKANPEPCEAPDADDPIRTCDATVDEVQACSVAELNQLIPLGSATCADLEGGAEEDPPAACVSLEEQCPGLGEDGSPQ